MVAPNSDLIILDVGELTPGMRVNMCTPTGKTLVRLTSPPEAYGSSPSYWVDFENIDLGGGGGMNLTLHGVSGPMRKATPNNDIWLERVPPTNN